MHYFVSLQRLSSVGVTTVQMVIHAMLAMAAGATF